MSGSLTSEWIEHDGGDCPVDPAAIVLVRFRDGVESHEPATAYNWDGRLYKEASCWRHANGAGDPNSDIIAYRVVSA